MITDEQRKAFEAWFRSMYGDSRMLRMRENPDIYDWLGHQVPWQAWQAAQQIKPLQFIGAKPGIRNARTQVGVFSLCDFVDEVRLALPEELNYFGRGYKTEDEAIEAANEDYQRRVLSCLVHGG